MCVVCDGIVVVADTNTFVCAETRGSVIGRGLPKFGQFKEERQRMIHKEAKDKGVIITGSATPSHVDVAAPAPRLTNFPQSHVDPRQTKDLASQIGTALSRIGAWNDLDGERANGGLVYVCACVCHSFINRVCVCVWQATNK